MKTFWVQEINIVLAIVFSVSESVKKDLLRSQDAVTSLVGSEDFYVQIKKIRPKTYVDDESVGQLRDADYTGKIRCEDSNEASPTLPLDQRKPEEEEVDQDLADKSVICERLFSRFLFEINHEYAVNFELKEEETKQELHQNHRDIYDDIYGKWPDVKDEFLNPYKQHVVTVGDEKFREQVLRCVTRRKKQTSETHSPGAYTGYFVSPIYQSWTEENLFVDGRFLFTKNDETDELKVFAVAEESAVINPDVIENTHVAYYYKYDAAEKRRRREESDADSKVLCKLSLRDKIRLCTIALNAPRFPDRIRFLPQEAFVEPNCEVRKVSAHLSVNKSKWYSFLQPKYVTRKVEFKYNERMIGCRAAQLMDDNELSWSTYYISRGIKEHTAIIFKESAKNIYSAYIGLHYVLMVKGPGTVKRIYGKTTVKPRVNEK